MQERVVWQTHGKRDLPLDPRFPTTVGGGDVWPWLRRCHCETRIRCSRKRIPRIRSNKQSPYDHRDFVVTKADLWPYVYSINVPKAIRPSSGSNANCLAVDDQLVASIGTDVKVNWFANVFL